MNPIEWIRLFYLYIFRNRLLVKDKTRADYVATDSEMLDHLINVVIEQAKKNIELIKQIEIKVKEKVATKYDFDNIERGMELLKFYKMEAHKLFYQQKMVN